MKTLYLCVAAVLISACGGGEPAPKTEDDAKQENSSSSRPKKDRGGAPSVSQELGSIDQRQVEVTFDKMQGRLQGCHKKGTGRIEYLGGDLKVFLRVGQDGKVKYGFFEESSLGDRETEKCILDLFNATDWPKPQGGEAEVRNAFGFAANSDRQPASWTSDKAAGALDEDKDVKKAVEQCKSGVSGTFKVTAYVEPSGEEEEAPPAKPSPGKKGGKPDAKKGPPEKKKTHGGKFKAIGVTAPGKDGADKIDCIVDALKPLGLPSPGSYAAKVSFSI